MTPLPPQWISGPQSTHANQGNGLRWATLQITETITWALPNRPDQIYTMSHFQTEISWKSPISLRGSSQMDLGIHQFSYFFKKQITSEQYTKPEFFNLHKDFHCFELLGFPSDLVSPLYVSKQTQKKHPCENTCISENINITKVISTIRPLQITTKIHIFFHYLLKLNLSQNQQQITEKRCFSKTLVLSTK